MGDVRTRDSLQRPGQYVAEEVAGNPVFVAVERDGSLRGFHNVCPHRAGVIVWPGSGTAGNLVCRYHGWAFDWDGKLKAARDFGDEAGLCPDDRALAPISVACWRNLVFVHLGDQPPPFDEAIAPFDAECEAFGIESFGYVTPRRAQPCVQLEDLRRQLPRGLPRRRCCTRASAGPSTCRPTASTSRTTRTASIGPRRPPDRRRVAHGCSATRTSRSTSMPGE